MGYGDGETGCVRTWGICVSMGVGGGWIYAKFAV